MSGFVLTSPALRRRPQQVPAAGWLAWLAEALRTVATRRQLAEMDDRMRTDIGMSRAEAFEEAGRAPWDLGPRA